MGNVFLAKDLTLGRRVAIKLLNADAEQDPAARERLRREARAAAALNHPYICQIHEIGEADGRLFIVLEYVDGETLHALATRSLLPLPQVVEFASEIVEALEHAHRRGVVHRDLKPSNVMVTADGHIKVMDFGLAKHQPATVVDPAGSTSLTDPGTRLGTPAYMSPEQVVGGALDGRSDLFSLGVILHELVTGRHPFLREDASATMAAILRDAPTAGPRDADGVTGVRALLQRLLAKAAAERFQTVSDLRAALDVIRERAWRGADAATLLLPLPTGAAPVAERTPFVGRTAETAELTRLLDRMLTGQGGIVLIGGEPGVGKTRLARECLREARVRGCLSLTGHCTEGEGAPPYAPFIEAVEQAVQAVPRMVRSAMGEQAGELSSVVSSLRHTYQDIPPPPQVPPEQQRQVVFSAFHTFIHRATHQSPTVVLLDDLHWTDEASLQLLLHLAPRLDAMRLLVVGTYRDVELDVVRPFARTLETLLRQRLATRISLHRLNESGVEQLLAAAGGSVPPVGLAHLVFQETEGNPFFVEEVYRHLLDEGKLFDAQGQWLTNLQLDALDVPEGVRLVIGRRLERLGEPARKVLTAAAVVGRRFQLDLLPSVADLSEDSVFDAIEAAVQAQLVAPEPNARDARYVFVHELIRTTLISGLLLPRRQRLHLRIADVIERQRASTPESLAAVLAHHYFQAGAAADPVRTAKFLILAGRQALGAGGFEDAVEAADRAIGLELGAQSSELADAHEIRGTAQLGLEHLAEATASLDQAFTAAAAAHDDGAVARITRAGTRPPFWQWRIGEVRDVVQRGLHALSDHAETERADLQAWLALSLAGLSRLDEAADEIAQAAERAEGLGNAGLLGRVLAAQTNCLLWEGEARAAADVGQRALRLLPTTAVWDRADVFVGLGDAILLSGWWAAHDAFRPEYEATARRAGYPVASLCCDFNDHILRWMRTGNTLAFLAQSERWVRDVPYMRFVTESCLGMAELYTGRSAAALARLTHLRDRQSKVLDHFDGLWDANLFAACALTGHLVDARAQLAFVGRKLPVAGQRNVFGRWAALPACTVALAHLGDTEECGALYPLLRELIAKQWVCDYWSVGPNSPQLVAGIAAHVAGLSDRAREHFESAQRQADELPYRLLQPTVGFWYGRFLTSQPASEEQFRGRAMVEAALEDFRSLEMVLHADLAERWLRGRAPS
jgi:tetratricopeptide (TPR) repeat protein